MTAQAVTKAPPTIAAVQNGWTVYPASNGTPMAAATRNFSAGATTGEGLIMDAFKVKGPTGGDMALTAARSVPWANLAKAVAKLNTAIALGDVAYEAYKLYQHSRCKPSADGWGCDDGVPPPEGQSYCVASSLTDFRFCAASPNDAVTASLTEYYNKRRADYPQYDWSFTVTGCNESICYFHSATDGYSSRGVTKSLGPLPCPPTQSEFLYGRFDGRCDTPGNPVLTPHTEDEVAAKVAPYPQMTDNPVKVIQEVLDHDGQVEAQPKKLTGPPETVGPTTVTTGPNGTTKDETKYINDYGPDRVTWGKIQTSTAPDGSVTTTTTDIPSDKPATDTPGLCDLYPDILACQKLGEAQDVELPKDTRQVSFEPDSGWGSGDAACPSNPTFSVHGKSFALDLDLVCRFMGGIRFAVIAAAWLVAAFIVLGARGGKSDE